MKPIDALEEFYEKFTESLYGKLPYPSLLPISVQIRWAIVALTPILFFALFFVLFVQSTVAETGTIKGDLEKIRADNKVSRDIEKRLPQMVAEIEKLDEQLDTMTRQLPGKKEIPDLLDQISNIGTRSGLEFQTFRPNENEVEKDFYAEVIIDLKMVGTFHNIVTFFDRISRMPRILTVSNMEIKEFPEKKKSAEGVFVSAKCSAITYRFLEEKVDVVNTEPPAKGKGK